MASISKNDKIIDNTNLNNQNSILKNENNTNNTLVKLNSNSITNNIKAGKNIFTTTPFTSYDNNNLNSKNESNANSITDQNQQTKDLVNSEASKNQKNPSKNYNILNNTLNPNTGYNNNHDNNINDNNESKNNINININTGVPYNSEKCFSPNSKNKTLNTTTNNILINTSNGNSSTLCNSRNSINININNSFISGSNANSIININNYCNGNFDNSNIKNNNTNNNKNNTNINNSNPTNNTNILNNINPNPNIINLSNFNTSLFQSLVAIDYKDPEKKKIKKRLKEMRIKHRRLHREGSYNCGRWQPEEHERFIEAIMKFGNEWKQVQKYVGTRSSTQARSHAQKFFVKIKRANILDFNIDLSKNSIKNLHEMANNLNSDQYVNAIKALNCVAFERKANSTKRKMKKDEQNIFGDSNMNISDDCDGKINLM